MSDEVTRDPTASLVTLMEMFHSAADALRPGARYVLVATDEALMLAFADHGGEILNTTVRKSNGPMKPHPSNPGWQPPTWDQTRIRVEGLTGDPTAQVPPIIWCAGPGVREIRPESRTRKPAELDRSNVIDLPPRRGELEQ